MDFFLREFFETLVACVLRRDEKNPLSKLLYLMWQMCGETRNSCLLLVEKWNGSRHLVVWSLGTLTGLRDRVRGLIA